MFAYNEFTHPTYASAAPAAQPAYVVTADLLVRYIWQVETPFMVALLSLAVLIFSLVMLQGVFHKLTAYMGIILGVIGVVGLALFSLSSCCLSGSWQPVSNYTGWTM